MYIEVFQKNPQIRIQLHRLGLSNFNPYWSCILKGVSLWQAEQVPLLTWEVTFLCAFTCVFTKWYFWMTCHKKYNASKSLYTATFLFKMPCYVWILSSMHRNSLLKQQTTVFEANFWKSTWKITWKKLQVKCVTCLTCYNELPFHIEPPYGLKLHNPSRWSQILIWGYFETSQWRPRSSPHYTITFVPPAPTAPLLAA